MKLNLSDIANRVRFGTHTIEILRGLIPDFPFEQVGVEEYPISFTFTDLEGNTHQMEYTIDDEVHENGAPVELGTLFRLLYGINSEEGQQAAIDFEGNYIRDTRMDTDFGFDSGQRDYFKEWFDPAFQTKKLKVEESPDTGRLKIHALSPHGVILATREYKLNQGLTRWTSYGVFRLDTDIISQPPPAIVVAGDPVTSQYLNEQGIPAIPLPCSEEIPYYDYADLFKGSEVYFAIDEFSGSYDFSLYPFAEHLMLHGINVHVVQGYEAFSQARVAQWVSAHGKQAFETALLDHSHQLHASQVPSKSTFDSSTSDEAAGQIIPAQHFMGYGFAYKLNASSSFVLSPPLRMIKEDELLHYEGLQADHSEKIDSVVTRPLLKHLEHQKYLDPAAIFEYLVQFLQRHLYFPHAETYTLLSCWILGTYLYRAFDAYPYLHFKGEAGSGKTTMLEILEKVSFNGKLLTKATVSSMTEEVHLRNATLCIDEFEDFSRTSSSHDELSRFLNGGYNYRGSYTKKYRSYSKTYSTYSPKAFGGTGSVNLDTLRSRMIAIQMQKKPETQTIRQFVEFEPETLSAIRLIHASAMAIPLHKSEEVISLSQRPLDNLSLPISGNALNNRQLQLARPLLTISSLVNQSVGAQDHVTQDLLTAIDRAWNVEDSNANEAEQLLKLQLIAWNEDPDFNKFRTQGSSTWIPNSLWETSMLMKYFSNKNEVLKWFDDLEGVEKNRIHFPHAGTPLGATKFSWDMKLCGEEFRSFFKK